MNSFILLLALVVSALAQNTIYTPQDLEALMQNRTNQRTLSQGAEAGASQVRSAIDILKRVHNSGPVFCYNVIHPDSSAFGHSEAEAQQIASLRYVLNSCWQLTASHTLTYAALEDMVRRGRSKDETSRDIEAILREKYRLPVGALYPEVKKWLDQEPQRIRLLERFDNPDHCLNNNLGLNAMNAMGRLMTPPGGKLKAPGTNRVERFGAVYCGPSANLDWVERAAFPKRF